MEALDLRLRRIDTIIHRAALPATRPNAEPAGEVRAMMSRNVQTWRIKILELHGVSIQVLALSRSRTEKMGCFESGDFGVAVTVIERRTSYYTARKSWVLTAARLKSNVMTLNNHPGFLDIGSKISAP
jgi:hypothetical protein